MPTAKNGFQPGLIVWQSSHQPNLNQTEFLTNKEINSYLFTEGALDFSPTKRNLLLIIFLKFLNNQLVRSATLFNLGFQILNLHPKKTFFLKIKVPVFSAYLLDKFPIISK